jgi:hypothetical protein
MGLDFLVLKLKNFSAMFSFCRKELSFKIELEVKIGKVMKASRGFRSSQMAEQTMG